LDFGGTVGADEGDDVGLSVGMLVCCADGNEIVGFLVCCPEGEDVRPVGSNVGAVVGGDEGRDARRDEGAAEDNVRVADGIDEADGIGPDGA
jgi:hypothetical protein